MLEPRRCCLCLLVASFARLHLGTETVSKSGCEGDSIELCHFSFDKNFTLVTMYKIDLQIAMLSMENSVIRKSLLNEYKDKIVFEIDGNVFIRNLSTSDEAKYKITVKKTEYWVCEVQLVVWVAPTTNCKPKIMRVDNVLTVHLEAKDCGKPVPSVHWLNHSGIFFEETKAIKLPPGRQSGIYYACIEGDALTCAKSSKLSDYCSFFKVDDGELFSDRAGAGVSKNDNLQEPSTSNQEVAANIGDNAVIGQSPIIIVIAISSVFSVILLLILLCAVYLLFKQKEMQNTSQGPRNAAQLSQDHDERGNDAQSDVEEQPSQDHDEYADAARSDVEEQPSQNQDEHENAAQSDVEESVPMLQLERIKEQPSQDHDERESAVQSDVKESMPMLQLERIKEQPSQDHDKHENAAQSDVEVHVPGHGN